MRKWIVCALILALLPGRALASPEPDQFHCLLTMDLETIGTQEEPLSRWAQEFVALIQPEIHSAVWAEGSALLVDIWVGNRFVFSIELLAEAGEAALMTSIGEGDWVRLPPDAARAATEFMARVREVLGPDVEWPQADSTLTVHVERGAEQLALWAAALREWAEVADDPNKDYVLAIAKVLSGYAEMVGLEQAGAPLLRTFVDYQPPSLVPGQVRKEWPEAEPSILADVIGQMPGELLRAIADTE